MPIDLAYCGAPPLPGALNWNFDPVLLSVLAGIGILYAAGAVRRPRRSRLEQTSFAIGFAILVLALISPLCHLSVALFSARVGQNLILTLVAAPLMAIGRPELIFAAINPSRAVLEPRFVRSVTLGAVAFAVTLWAWHLPYPYNATLRSDAIYWIMHISMMLAAIWFWRGLFDANAHFGAAVLAGLATAVHMSLLGALLTFAPRPLFGLHANTTIAWGFSALEDQQLGGLLMWAPGGVIFVIYVIVALGLWLGRAQQRSLPRA